MNQINITNTHILLSTETGNIPLLSLHNFFQNKSRVPLHTISDSEDTIVQFLLEMKQKNESLFSGKSSAKQLAYFALDSLLVAELMKSAAPVKIAEFGCTQGDISYNLTEVAGKMNPKSSLWLISNVIGNNSGNNCLNLITQAEHCPDLSMIYCDYTDTNLAEQTFDIVIINGDIDFNDPYAVIKEAERVTKKDGILLCYSHGNYLLQSTFQLIFSERNEYPLTHADTILLTKKHKNSWRNTSGETPLAVLSTIKKSIQDEISSTNNICTYRSCVKQLNNAASWAASLYDIEKKINLIQWKEALLDYMNHLHGCQEEYYKNRLLDFLNKSN